jgi:hypothetical protein
MEADDTPSSAHDAAPVTTARRPRRRATDDRPPERPRDLSPRQLRFTRQHATRWFSPGVLGASGLHVAITAAFGSFLDKRELQSSHPCEPDLRYADRDELWLDYVADTGDGFAATATVAHHVSRAELDLGDGTSLPRGDILVFGGDEVYPTASTEGYEDRLEGPWRAALPWTEPTPTDPAVPDDPAHPTVYAVPGNHDWYDGLTGFLRMFGQGRWIGGWRTHQTRSYFAVRLPHRWWLWGVDIQAETLIDEPQLQFFDRVAQEFAEPGDRVVLATAVPSWTQLERSPQAYRNLAYLERVVLQPAGLELKLTMAGDLHHYARYEHVGADDEVGPTHKITSGGGGAFLHPTHDLPVTAEIAVDPDAPGEVAEYRLTTRYPSAGRSRMLSLAALLLPFRNPSFCVIPAVLSVVLLWTIQFGLRSLERSGTGFAEAAPEWSWLDLAGGIGRNSLSALLMVVLLGALWAFAQAPPWARRRGTRLVTTFVLAAVHLAAQVVAMTTVTMIALRVASPLDGWWFAATASVVAFVLGGAAGALVVGFYLAAAIGLPGVRAHANEAFAAARITGYKNFLRMHIDREGVLTVHAVGIDRAVKRGGWRAVPEADGPEAAWIEPRGRTPRPHLIERVAIR